VTKDGPTILLVDDHEELRREALLEKVHELLGSPPAGERGSA
jgi:hypothetical protein